MTDQVINPLRRRMVEDMTIRNFDQRTQQSYMRSVRSCCRYCDRRPSELTFEDVRLYQLHLSQSGLAPASVNGAMVVTHFRAYVWSSVLAYNLALFARLSTA